MKKNPIILLLMLALSSCIYKYTPDVSGEYGRVVIEGDISIGTVSHFSASRVIPLGVSFAGAVSPGVSKASFKVEDEDGTEYKEKGSTGDIDLSSASADKRYRLVAEVTVEGEDPVEYVSDWQYPAPAPEIGDLVETVVDDRLCLALNLSSDGGSGCYRWEYEELYKYRSPMGEPTLEFSVADTAIMDHSHASDISEVQRWWKYSWCWMETRSRRSAVAIAKALEGSNLVNHEFMTMERSSDKIAAGEYYIRLIARTIPEDQYLYLNAVNEGSENTGSLFSPLPGEQIGNIRNSKDPDDYALGYVGVNLVAKKLFKVYTKGTGRRFNVNAVTKYMVKELSLLFPYMTLKELTIASYNMGYYPYRYDADFTLSWVPKYCFDCRLSGGKIDKPTGWD